jgi:hypothetical protein
LGAISANDLLTTLVKIAFHHGPGQLASTRGPTGDDVIPHGSLTLVFAAGIAVAAVDDDDFLQIGLAQECTGRGDAGRIVVGLPRTAAAQHDVRPGVAAGTHEAGAAVFVRTQECMGLPRRPDGIGRYLKIAFGTVLDADRHGQTAGHLSMRLRLDRARADARPADQVSGVLRGNGVQHLGRDRKTHTANIEKQTSGQSQALLEISGTIEVGVVHEALPTDNGARFFEITAHEDTEPISKLASQLVEFSGVFQGGVRVVDATGADDGQHAVISARQDALDFHTSLDHSVEGDGIRRHLSPQLAGRSQRGCLAYVQILNGFHQRSPRVKSNGHKKSP